MPAVSNHPHPSSSIEPPLYLVLDTESSFCHFQRRRYLVSLAYEVIDAAGGVRVARYHLVRPHQNACPDASSERIHGISLDMASNQDTPSSLLLLRFCWAGGVGRPVDEYGSEVTSVLTEFFHALETHCPTAVVGHDITGDVNLLISEAICHGLSCARVPAALQRLVCTRMLATQPCAIPLPMHLRFPYPCDATLQQLNGRSHPPTRRAATEHGPATGPCTAPLYKWPSLEESYNLLERIWLG